MTAGPWTFPNTARTSLVNGDFALATDTFNIALFSSSWTPSDAGAYADTYELATANGYTRGGISLGTMTLSGTTTVKVTNSVSIVWTAATGSLVARYAAIYKPSGKFMCWCNLDAGGGTPVDVTITVGNTLSVTMNSAGIWTLA